MTLSGFLFAMIGKNKEIDFWSFYRNRLLRIYPLFSVFILLAFYLDPANNSWSGLLSSLLFLQNSPSAVHLQWFTEAAWTIAVECQFYLIFPVLLISFRRYGYKYLVGLIGLAMLTRLAIYLTTGTVYNIAYLTIFGRIDQFIIGMILGLLFERIRGWLRHPIVLLCALVTLLLSASCFHTIGGSSSSVNSSLWIYWSTLEGLVWAFIIAAYNGSTWTFPAVVSKCLAFGGTLSFSMYLLHIFGLRLLPWFNLQIWSAEHYFPLLANILCHLRIHPFTAAMFFGLCLVLPTVLFCSVLTYLLIEKPFLDLRVGYTKNEGLDSATPKDASKLIAEIASEQTSRIAEHSAQYTSLSN